MSPGPGGPSGAWEARGVAAAASLKTLLPRDHVYSRTTSHATSVSRAQIRVSLVKDRVGAVLVGLVGLCGNHTLTWWPKYSFRI